MQVKIFYSVVLAFVVGGCSMFSGMDRSRFSNSRQVANYGGGSGGNFELQRMEQSLTNRRELEQYSRLLPWFENTEERIEFLRLPGLEARNQWIQERHFFERPSLRRKEMLDLIEKKDIAIGMPENLVKESWGEADVIEVSGHPLFKNMIWRYNQQQATEEGFVPHRKSVYFEAGKVTGWDSD